METDVAPPHQRPGRPDTRQITHAALAARLSPVRPEPPSADVADDVLRRRCPYLRRGVVAHEAMAACPGFVSERPRESPARLHPSSPPSRSCGHLAGQAVSRGRYVPACHHPEAAAWVVEAARTSLQNGAIRAEAHRCGPGHRSTELLVRAVQAGAHAAALCGTTEALLLAHRGRRHAAS
jgi:hypothetical protein